MTTSFNFRAKRKAYRLVEPVENESPIERAADIALLAVIFISVTAFVLGTVPSIAEKYGSLINGIEIVAAIIFSAEYLIRLWSCTSNEEFRDPIWGRIRYALQPMMIIDLLAIVPFYLAALGGQFFVLRILRLFRILRILKVNRYSAALTAVRNALREKAPELMITVSIMLTLIFISSTLLYYAEYQIEGTAFTSIPAAMWTAVAGLTPLGFDGAFPDTTIGRVLMVLVAIFGVGTFALPSGIFASAFSSQLSSANAANSANNEPPPPPASIHIVCPHCQNLVEAKYQKK